MCGITVYMYWQLKLKFPSIYRERESEWMKIELSLFLLLKKHRIYVWMKQKTLYHSKSLMDACFWNTELFLSLPPSLSLSFYQINNIIQFSWYLFFFCFVYFHRCCFFPIGLLLTFHLHVYISILDIYVNFRKQAPLLRK